MASDLLQNNVVNDNAQAQTGFMSGASDWVSSTASDIWSATRGGATVVGQVAYGAGKEVYDHPLKTAGEVAAAAGVAVCLTEAGITGTAAAAVAAVPLAGYGIYRGGQIAATEGVGAIPDHIKQTWDEGKQYAGKIADAASTVYSGSGQTSESAQSGDSSKVADAKEQLQQLGYDAAPYAAAGVGVASSGMFANAARVGISATGDLLDGALRSGLLPSLSLEPAFAGASAGSSAGLGLDGATAGGATHALANGWNSGFGANEPQVSFSIKDSLTSDFQKRSFVDGSEPARVQEAEKGFASNLVDAFKKFAKNDGDAQEGYLNFTRLQDGYHKIDVVDGAKAGASAQYKPGDGAIMITGPEGKFDFHTFEE